MKPFVLEFDKLGPQERALVYAYFRCIPTGLWPSCTSFSLEEMCALQLMYVPRKAIDLIKIRESSNKLHYPPVPIENWIAPKIGPIDA